MDADQARAQIAEANQRAAEATAQAAKAQLELEKFRAPRDLDPTQQSAVALAVSTFAGTKFDVACAHEREPLNLLAKIEGSLLTARWEEVLWTGADIVRVGRPNAGTVISEGVSIQVEQSQQTALLPIAKALAKALSDEGVAAAAEFSNTNMPSANHAAIHIVVGTKP
jgi:hypothetical protein